MNRGREYKLEEVKMEMITALNMRNAPGRLKMTELSSRYPEIFSVKRNGDNGTSIIVHGERQMTPRLAAFQGKIIRD
jgi:hypothetical protein